MVYIRPIRGEAILRRLANYLLIIFTLLAVTMAISVTALRIMLPHIDAYRNQIMAGISSLSHTPIKTARIEGRFRRGGVAFALSNVDVALTAGETLRADKIYLTLDLWRSLLHWRWQFGDVEFSHLNYVVTLSPLPAATNSVAISHRLLHQFERAIVNEARIVLTPPSGRAIVLTTPRLVWINTHNRHRAQGDITLSSGSKSLGTLQVRLNLQSRRKDGALDSGQMWLQGDNVNVKPWIDSEFGSQPRLISTQLNLTAWLTLKSGVIDSGDIKLGQSEITWRDEQQKRHRLATNDLLLHLTQSQADWTLSTRQTTLTTDGLAWPPGQLALMLVADATRAKAQQQPEIRLRASGLNLARIVPLLSLFSSYLPRSYSHWAPLQPRGVLSRLALDVPMLQPDTTRFIAAWRDVTWRQSQWLPAVRHLQGEAAGSLQEGRLSFRLAQGEMLYDAWFSAPLQLHRGSAELHWKSQAGGWEFVGRNIDLRARSLDVNGDFIYRYRKDKPTQLNLLAGINSANIADTWRYLPKSVNNALRRYLTSALKNGHFSNATLLFVGDPAQFPFRQQQGVFQLTLPVRNATLAFQPDWPALKALDADVSFVNNGLLIKAKQARFGAVAAEEVTASIDDYRQETLRIEGRLRAKSEAVYPYIQQTPLKSTLGNALQALQLQGDVRGRLQLLVPLHSHHVVSSGDIELANNRLKIPSLHAAFDHVSGKFHFRNGDLSSERIQARWRQQPLVLRFATQEKVHQYQIHLALNSVLTLTNAILPVGMLGKIAGSIAWRGEATIKLAQRGKKIAYQAMIRGDGNRVSSRLPPPLDKTALTPLPASITLRGDRTTLNVAGRVANRFGFNSVWRVAPTPRLQRAAWAEQHQGFPALPTTQQAIVNLPAFDGDIWLNTFLGLMADTADKRDNLSALLPDNLRLRVPQLTFAGQAWHNIDAAFMSGVATEKKIRLSSRELRGELTLASAAPWSLNLDYLYYNPLWQRDPLSAEPPTTRQFTSFPQSSPWPTLKLICRECWFVGQKVGQIAAELKVRQGEVELARGLVDSGNAKLAVTGVWTNRADAQRTALKGTLEGHNVEETANWFGLHSSIRGSPFKLRYDLRWRAEPWRVDLATLGGDATLFLGKGEIVTLSTGRTGQLLRLISFDALLRKLRLDFSDTFAQGFWFDTIKSSAKIKNGVLSTHDLLINSLEANIEMRGKVDLVRRQIDMRATVAPELSAPVGVAAAFAINPFAGAAIFTLSRIFSPIWNKIALLRYHVSGSLDKPQVDKEPLKIRKK